MHAQNTKRIAVGRRSLANSERDGSLIHQNRKMRKILRRKNPSQMRITEQKHKRHPHKSLRKCNRKRSQTQWKPVEPKCNIHQTPSTQTRKTPNQVMGIHFNSSPWFRPKESGARLRRKRGEKLERPPNIISAALVVEHPLWGFCFQLLVHHLDRHKRGNCRVYLQALIYEEACASFQLVVFLFMFKGMTEFTHPMSSMICKSYSK